MLKVHVTEQLHNRADCVMLLGGFDGLHIGHKKLLAKAKNHALPIAIMTIIGGKDSQSLFTPTERTALFKRAGIDCIFQLPFAKIKDMSPQDFAKLLCKEFSPKVFVCGDDFRFGKNAAGDAILLKETTQVCVEVENLVKVDGEKVSTTRLKKLLAVGEVEKANALLGEEFFVIGQVVKDRQIGRTIGFPTANIAYPPEKFPLKKGVYETRVCVDGVEYKGITNYGARPTFFDESLTTETYLDGYVGELYGKSLCVRFIRFLREVQKFDDAQALKRQLQRDIGRVRND